MEKLNDFLASVKTDVDRRLDELLPGVDVAPQSLHEAIRWSVFAGGKRVRPALTFAVGESLGADRRSLADTAAAIEMIHSYSLIHDDLPSMDDDDLRRGRATCHVKYGEATAILAGDALQSLAFYAIASDDTLTPHIRIELLKLITAAASTPNGMVAGQQLDLDGESTDLSVEAITEIHRGKTGAMITASVMSGALIADADAEQLTAVRKFGEKLGLLFQIADDLLDVTQETSVLGKTAGKDAAASKATFPSIYGVGRTREIAGEICRDAKIAISDVGGDTTMLAAIADFILDRDR